MRRSLWAKGGGVGNRTNEAQEKGMKIMAIVGIAMGCCSRLSIGTAVNHHEVRLRTLCFDFYMIEAKPENLIGDHAYDR